MDTVVHENHYIWPDPRELVGVAEYELSTLGADTNRVALGVTPRVLPLHVQPYSSNGQPCESPVRQRIALD